MVWLSAEKKKGVRTERRRETKLERSKFEMMGYSGKKGKEALEKKRRATISEWKRSEGGV